MSAQALDSFYVDLFFKGDTSAAEKFSSALDDVKSKALSIVGAATAAASGVLAFVGAVAHGMGELHDFAETNNLSASSVAAFGKVAKALDVDMETLKGSMQGLNGIIGEASLGVGRGAMIFEKLGLTAKDSSGKVKNVDDMLAEVSDRIKDMPRPEQLAFLQKLRIDPRMVKVLEKGGDALRKMREEAEGYSPFTDEDYAKADKIDKLFGRVAASMGMLSKILAVKLFPAVEKILNTFLEWFAAQRKATDGVFVKAFKLLGDVLGNLWFWIVKLKDGLFATFEYLNKYKVLTYALITALSIYAGVAIANALAATGEFILSLRKKLFEMAANVTMVGLMTGALKLLKLAINGLLAGAIFLIIEDLAMWYTGNESLLGQLEERYPGALKLIITSILALTIAMNTFGIRSALAWLLALGPVVLFFVALGAFVVYAINYIANLCGGFENMARMISESVSKLWGWIKAYWYVGMIWLEDTIGEIGEWFDRTWLRVKDGFNGFLGFIASIGQQIAAIWDQYVMAPFRESIALIMKAKDMITGSFDSAVNMGKGAANYVSDAASNGWNATKNFLGFGGNDKNGVLGSAANPAQQTSNNNVNVNGVTVNVSTNNPAEMGNAVDGAIKNSLRNSQTSVAY